MICDLAIALVQQYRDITGERLITCYSVYRGVVHVIDGTRQDRDARCSCPNDDVI